MSVASLSLFINDVVSYNADHVITTRKQAANAASSCRMWQLILCILDHLTVSEKRFIYYNHGTKEYYEMISKISGVLDMIKADYTLNSLIYMNDVIDGEVINYDPDAIPLKMGNNYMCIYIEGVSYSILHYFTVIKLSEEECYLNSSYASDYVRINQYTTRLDMNEFNRFARLKGIRKFFLKYFLDGGLPVEGIEKEIRVFTENRYKNKIRCGIMPNYGSMIGRVIHRS